MRDQVYSTRIEDYLEAIAGCDAFFVADREYGRIINYRQMGPDVFPDPHKAPDAHTARLWGLRRQCRGLVFDLTGNVISPGFDKFRNVNECEETLAHNIDWDLPHVIMVKEDGSMIRPIPMPHGGYRLGTKMGITWVSEQAEAWVSNHPQYDRLCKDLLAAGWVPLLEWCSRENRIVIDYPVDRLIMLSIRNVRTGEYMPLHMMLEWALDYDVEVVGRYPGTAASMMHLMEETRGLQDQEGWVIWFDNGYRVKVKADQYVMIHKAKDRILRENAVIHMILDEQLDDLKAILPDSDRDMLERFETAFWQGVNATAHAWSEQFGQIKAQYGADRKAFALGAAVSMQGYLRAAMFQNWDASGVVDWEQAVVDVIRKNTQTQTKTDEHRALWGQARWQANSVGDE